MTMGSVLVSRYRELSGLPGVGSRLCRRFHTVVVVQKRYENYLGHLALEIPLSYFEITLPGSVRAEDTGE